MNLDVYSIGYQTMIAAPSQKSVRVEDFSYISFNDVAINTDNAATYTSGDLDYVVSIKDITGTVVTVSGTITYNSTKAQTMADLITALLLITNVRTAAYNGVNHTTTLTVNPGYRVTDFTLSGTFGGTGLTFVLTYTGGVWQCKHAGIAETAKGIISTSDSKYIYVLPHGDDTTYLSYKWKKIPIQSYSKNEYCLFDYILVSPSSVELCGSGVMQILF